MKLGLFFLSLSIAAAQSVGVGVKGGVPFNDVFRATGLIGSEPFHAHTQRFTIGPMLDVRLPLGVGIEFDALYKQFDQTGGAVSGGTLAKTGRCWEFPLLGKYRFGSSALKPYVEGGVSFNRLSGYLLPFRTLPSAPASQPEGSSTRTGLALGAGIELKLPLIRISPGIRFSHWGDNVSVPSTNAADFLVGVSF